MLSPFFNATFSSLLDLFFTFCIFLCIMMYILNIAKAIQKMSVNETKDFIFENYYKRIGFSKENSYYSMRLLKKKDVLLLANKLKISRAIKKNYLSTKNF